MRLGFPSGGDLGSESVPAGGDRWTRRLPGLAPAFAPDGRRRRHAGGNGRWPGRKAGGRQRLRRVARLAWAALAAAVALVRAAAPSRGNRGSRRGNGGNRGPSRRNGGNGGECAGRDGARSGWG